MKDARSNDVEASNPNQVTTKSKMIKDAVVWCVESQRNYTNESKIVMGDE
jgi:hypothetical protein